MANMDEQDIIIKQIGLLMQTANITIWNYWPKNNQFVLLSAPNKHFRNITTWQEYRGLVDQQQETPLALKMLLTGEQNSCDHDIRIILSEAASYWLREIAVITQKEENGNPACITGFLMDITQPKENTASLRAISEYREVVAHQAGLAGWEWHAKGNYMTFHDDYQTLLGLCPEDLNGSIESVCRNHLHPDDVSNVLKYTAEYVNHPQGVFSLKFRMRHKEGHYIWVQDNAKVIEWDEQGRALHLLGGVLNIDRMVRAEQQLRETNTSMVAANPHINLLFHPSGQLIDCNPEALQLFQVSSKNELLEDFDNIFSRMLPALKSDGTSSISLADNLAITMEKGFHQFEAEFKQQHNHLTFDVYCKKIPYEDAHAMVAYLSDITSLKQTQRELERRESTLKILHTMTSELISISPDSFKDLATHALERLGLAMDVDRVRIWHSDGDWVTEILSWDKNKNNSIDYVNKRHINEMPYRHAKMLAGETLNGPVAHMPEPERHIFARQNLRSLLFIPLFIANKYWGFIGFDDLHRDHTFTAEEEGILHSSGNIIVAAYLQNEMTKELIRTKEEALSNASAKTDFLSRMSHEIRTPMNAIIGMTSIAGQTNDPARIKNCLEKIDSSSKQLLNIINDILDMSKIEANKFEIVHHEFDFEKMLKHVFTVAEVKLNEKNIDFFYDIENIFDRQVISDELRLSQVFINLLTNAIKFTPEHGKICLKVRHVERNGDVSRLRIEVVDNGIGIAPERIPYLFESFEQADGSITRQYGGTGLGLAICKQIIRLMDGDIWVESTLGGGSSFIVELNVGWGSLIQSNSQKPVLSKDLRILVVDDAEDVLDYMKVILASFSLTADAVGNPLEAIELVRQACYSNDPYDVVFIDWFMPEINGGEVAKQIRRLLGDSVLIVMISASDWNTISSNAFASGVTHYLQKPILPSAVFNTLLRLVSSEAEAKKEETVQACYNWAGKRILLAEDIAINREIVEALLEDTGVEIIPAVNGLEALELFLQDQNRYDLILMDVQMPILDGLSATRKIRSIANNKAVQIPIIAMTANAFKEDELRCLEAGMNGHIAKPVVVDILRRTLAAYLN